jgi:RND family efflux transporter MFP subunit
MGSANRRPWGRYARGIGLAALLLGAAGGGVWWLRHREPPPAESEEREPAPPPGQVTLPEGAREAAGVRVATAEISPVSATYEVAGVVEPDHDLSVEIRAYAPAVVRRVLVNHGQQMKRGEPLAILESSEVAAARRAVQAREREVAAARMDGDWKATITGNVGKLIEALRGEEPLDAVDRKFRDQMLGSRRGDLMAAAGALETARVEELKQRELESRGVIGSPKAALAARTLVTARAAFDAAAEQARYDARRESLLAEQAVRNAEGNLDQAKTALALLGAELAAEPGQDLAIYAVKAPFDGTVLDRPIAPSQRVTPQDVLFPFADLSQVHVAAHVPESDVGQLPAVGDEVSFAAAAFPDRGFRGYLHTVGSEVDPKTRTVMMLAHAENPDRALRLGMFVRLRFERIGAKPVLNVPSSAVVRIDGRDAVFLSEGAGTFARRFVVADPPHDGRCVIHSGIKPGDEIAVGGGFVLKSTLALLNDSGGE